MGTEADKKESLAVLIAKSLEAADDLGLEMVAIRLSEALDLLASHPDNDTLN
jgi:hypothetical protein